MGIPERQCVGCGRRAPQAELMRLCAARDEGTRRVVPSVGRERSGRGAYLCRREVCLERAVMRKAFQRAFKTSVEIDKDELEAAIRSNKTDKPGERA